MGSFTQELCHGYAAAVRMAGGDPIALGPLGAARTWGTSLDDIHALIWTGRAAAHDRKYCSLEDREAASFATLMQIQHVTPSEPLTCPKRDRRGWVVLAPGERQLALDLHAL